MQRAITSFRGESPRITPRALPDNAAQDATNARLLTGDLTAWRQFLFTHALANAGPVQTISLMAGTYWLSWDADVDVARGIIPGDTTYRTYLTSPGFYSTPRYTNLALATTGGPEPYPVATRPLGVPPPDSVPTVVLGIDPTATGFFVDITDAGDALSSAWTTSPIASGSNYTSDVTQDAGIGNPAPSYKLHFLNNADGTKPCYAYRNFGIAAATIIAMDVDFYMTAAGGQYQARIRIANDSTGVGLSGQVHFPFGTSAGPYLSISSVSSWADAGSSLVEMPVGALTMATWYHMYMRLVKNADGTSTLTATLSQGSTSFGSVTHTATIGIGDFCGYTAIAADLGSAQATYFDNTRVQASGSLNTNEILLATSYVFTYVNDIGEESAPSLPSATVVRADGVSATVTTSVSIPTGISDDYSITTKRLYRAATGNTGTVFRFVAEIPLTQADYVDTLTDAELGEVLPSDIWALPPDDLEGILALPNGVMAGFSKNELCLSAQNHPHAWPVEYRLTTDTNIIGIGNIDNTVVIGTESFVYVATGNDPAAYSMSKFEVPHSCMSKRSFAYMTRVGVIFAGPDGLLAVTGIGQVVKLTSDVFTDLQWKAYNPASMRAVAHNDIYWLFWEAGSERGCFAIDLNPAVNAYSQIPGTAGFGIVPMSFHASAMYVNPVGDTMYLVLDQAAEPDDPSLPVPPSTPAYIDGTHIYEFEGSPTDLMTYRYRSKLWMLERPATFQIAQVRAEDYGNLLVRVYGDGVQVDEIAITDEIEFTLATTDEYRTVEIEILGTSTVRIVQVAEDVAELA